ncbi:MAG: hypothetical protein GEV10_09890 [Streptosporangiales bacterium]|nr:hypothetical protein [Streptosporangiales bacterium]
MRGISARRRLVCVTLAIGLALTGCSSGGGTASPSNGGSGPGKPVSGGELVAAVNADPTSLHPWQYSSVVDRHVLVNVYDRLIERSPVDFTLKPSIAKTWSVSKDGLTATLNLQDGVTFHDGSKLTSKDVVFSIEQARDPAASRTSALLSAVETVEAKDPLTVVLALSKPDIEIFNTLEDVFVAPARPKADYNAEPIGSGPFKFVSWSPNNQVVLEKYDGYWRDARPYLDKVTFKVIPDQSTALLQLQSGQVDMMAEVSYAQTDQVTKGGAALEVPRDKVPGGYYEIFVNTREKPWSDKRVRQALSYAIDRPGVKKVLPGIFTPTSNPVPSSRADFSDAAASYDEQNIAKAKQLLADAGHPNGFDAGEMYVYSDAGSDYQVLAQVIQDSAAKAGITMKIRTVDLATWADTVLAKEKYGIALGGAVPKPTDYDYIAHTWGKALGAATGWQEQAPEFYRLLASARTQTDKAAYAADLKELQNLGMDGQAMIVVGGRTVPVARSANVHGFVANSQNYLLLRDTWKQR